MSRVRFLVWSLGVGTCGSGDGAGGGGDAAGGGGGGSKTYIEAVRLSECKRSL